MKRLNILLVCASLSILTGCAADSSNQTEPTLYTLAYAEKTGGMCPDGACFAQMTLMSDGGWTVAGSGGDSDGHMSEEDVQAIKTRIGKDDLAELELRPDDYTCPIAYDGTMTTYTFYDAKGASEKVDSCSHVLDDFVPAKIIEEVWASVD